MRTWLTLTLLALLALSIGLNVWQRRQVVELTAELESTRQQLRVTTHQDAAGNEERLARIRAARASGDLPTLTALVDEILEHARQATRPGADSRTQTIELRFGPPSRGG